MRPNNFQFFIFFKTFFFSLIAEKKPTCTDSTIAVIFLFQNVFFVLLVPPFEEKNNVKNKNKKEL